tara:strand:+ start:100 stop:585 length:486 start_codon:yes stop_codon:yes gene_type:complete
MIPVKNILILAFFVFMMDQLTKLVVIHYMDLSGLLYIKFLPPIMNFKMAWNEGINFGLFASRSSAVKWFLILIALVICLYFLAWMRNETRIVHQIFGGLIIGGALGNVFDRLLYGAVADFINISCCGLENPYSFNLADTAIFVGVFGIILNLDRYKHVNED